MRCAYCVAYFQFVAAGGKSEICLLIKPTKEHIGSKNTIVTGDTIRIIVRLKERQHNVDLRYSMWAAGLRNVWKMQVNEKQNAQNDEVQLRDWIMK